MRLDRLFEMVYLLLDRPSITAGELAERFEVSVRTVYRDVETLSQAGVPIYAQRGKEGGIRLMEGFVLDKTALSQEERRNVLAALQGMGAAGSGETRAALDKLSALFGGQREDWVEVEFTAWRAASPASRLFQTLKEAILRRRVVTFRYSGAHGVTRDRTAEPVRLVYRGSDWYLLAWCRWRQDFRYFKLSRMEDLAVTGEEFARRTPPPAAQRAAMPGPELELVLAIDPAMAYRVREEFPPDRREEGADGSFTVRLAAAEDAWLYSYLMTYGGSLRVLEPARVRARLAQLHQAAWKKNQEER